MSASQENAISKTFHTLKLIAGLDASPTNKTRLVDLNVQGGVIIKKNMIVCGNIDVGDFINANITGDIFTSNIIATNMTEGITVNGNLIIDNEFIITSNIIQANTITSEEDTLTLQTTDMIIINTPETILTGNLIVGNVNIGDVIANLLARITILEAFH